MKRGGAITMIISFLLVAVTSCAVVSGENEIVRDTLTRPVRSDRRYYIQQVNLKSNMWLTTNVSDPKTPCLERRVVCKNSMPEHARIMFIPIEGNIHVRVSTELNIVMLLSSKCGPYGFWRVADSSSKIKEVVLGGFGSSNDSIFTIQRADSFIPAYRFAFGNSTDISFVEKGSDVPVFGTESAFVFVPRRP